MKCPLYGSESFYVMDPDDEYEVYEFNLHDGQAVFSEEVNEKGHPAIETETYTFCSQCAWHGKFGEL